MSTILLTAAGSASAGSLLTRYRELGHRVICCDIYPRSWNVTCCQADAFFQALPVTDQKAYLEQMEEAVKREQVDFLLPLTDVEVDVLSKERSRFLSLGCIVCTPGEDCVSLCRDKLRCGNHLRERGACTTIPTAPAEKFSPKEGDFPLMLKPVNGRSSQGLQVVHNREQYLSALSRREDYIAQPYLSGSILTVETARDGMGQVWAVVRRELLRTVNGLGTTVEILPGHPLETICGDIAREVGLLGVVNMEFIEHEGQYFFLEINPRFSGGVGFVLASGVDFAGAEIAIHQGKELGPRPEVRGMILSRRITAEITQTNPVEN